MYNTTTDSSTTFLNVRRIDLVIPGMTESEGDSFMYQLLTIDPHATMLNMEVFGQGPEGHFTFSYVYEQQLKEVKKLYFKLKLRYSNIKYSY